jgi:hypothetical protein
MALWGARIVVVDEDSDHVEAMTRLLARAGAQVIQVDHPGQAIATIAGVLPDLAIVEVMMPGIDALGLLRKVRTLSPEKGGQVPAPRSSRGCGRTRSSTGKMVCGRRSTPPLGAHEAMRRGILRSAPCFRSRPIQASFASWRSPARS